MIKNRNQIRRKKIHQSDSGLANGTSGSPQTTLEQQTLKQKVAENEAKIKREEYLRNELSKSSPLKIPESAQITDQRKNGYDQVKYNWERGEYKYQSRWHTRTPGAPQNQSNTWVVEKRKPGIGSGPDARSAEHFVLIGKSKNGSYKWVDKKKWDAAIRARKNGSATKEQKEMLDNGQWKA